MRLANHITLSQLARSSGYPRFRIPRQHQLCVVRLPGTQLLTRSGRRGAAEFEPLLQNFIINLGRSFGSNHIAEISIPAFSYSRMFAGPTATCGTGVQESAFGPKPEVPRPAIKDDRFHLNFVLGNGLGTIHLTRQYSTFSKTAYARLRAIAKLPYLPRFPASR